MTRKPGEEHAALLDRIAALERRLARSATAYPYPSPLSVGKLLDKLPGMVYHCRNDLDWSMEYVNAGATILTGWSPEDFGQNRLTYNRLIVSADRQGVWDDIQRALTEKRDFELFYRIRSADNSLKWVWEHGWGLWSDDGELLALEGIVTDISPHKRAEQALLESEQRYRRIVEHSQQGVWMLDGDHRITFVNPRLTQMLGYTSGEMLGASLPDFIAEEYRAAAQSALTNRPCSGIAEQHDFKLLCKDGRDAWALISANPIIDPDRGYSGMIVTAIDITDRKHMETTLHQLAISDPLTGLFNRRHFYDLAQCELQRVQRYRSPLAAIMIDLDNFKTINDRYGHLTGDQVIQAVARILSNSVRQIDILCRYGGEEFAILLPETDLRTASATAERLRAMLDTQPIETDQGPLRLTISLGVAGIHKWRDITVETLLDHADRMLYAAKDGGRNQVAVWDLSTHRKVRTKLGKTISRNDPT